MIKKLHLFLSFKFSLLHFFLLFRFHLYLFSSLFGFHLLLYLSNVLTTYIHSSSPSFLIFPSTLSCCFRSFSYLVPPLIQPPFLFLSLFPYFFSPWFSFSLSFLLISFTFTRYFLLSPFHRLSLSLFSQIWEKIQRNLIKITSKKIT